MGGGAGGVLLCLGAAVDRTGQVLDDAVGRALVLVEAAACAPLFWRRAGGGGVEVGQLYLTLVVLCFSTAVLVP